MLRRRPKSVHAHGGASRGTAEEGSWFGGAWVSCFVVALSASAGPGRNGPHPGRAEKLFTYIYAYKHIHVQYIHIYTYISTSPTLAPEFAAGRENPNAAHPRPTTLLPSWKVESVRHRSAEIGDPVRGLRPRPQDHSERGPNSMVRMVRSPGRETRAPCPAPPGDHARWQRRQRHGGRHRLSAKSASCAAPKSPKSDGSCPTRRRSTDPICWRGGR